ncbi:MAG TPA: gliding motility-associated C-terminal domain-containing protein, partial [Bacteroidales bacterium]|nr:gliding motility-associated C-terminal domain-containing protein [Bacteroidales bacterium]
ELPIGFYTFDLYDRNIVKPDVLECTSDTAKNRQFEVAPAAKTKIVGDTLACVNTVEVMYTVETVPSVASTYIWSVTGNRLNYSKDANSSAVRYIDWDIQGVDTITVYENTYAGCEGFDTLIVKVANYPVPNFTFTMPGASNVVEYLDSTTQKNVTDKLADGTVVEYPVTYTMYWNFAKTKDDDLVDLVVDYKDRKKPVTVGGYVVGPKYPILTVENSYGCKAKVSKEVYIDVLGNIYVPTAFAPTNPAAAVRVFQPVTYGVEKCEVWIFDKWGNLIWYSDEVEDGIFVGKWDGTYNGEMLQSDTYIWKIEANYVGGNEWTGLKKPNGTETKFGSVVLLR